ncbi:MAG: response regulator transcription factor [Rhodothermia bacterium]|mgnify:CR=1 FL=1|nr:response regulator transcription factor [Rhodothermia bacterium]
MKKSAYIKVMIVDDGAFLDTCSRYFAGTEINVVATATSAEDAITQAIAHQNHLDVMVLDVDLGHGGYATDVIRELKKQNVHLKTLIVSGLVHEVAYVLPFKGQVEGILHKNEDKALIKKAIRGIASGKTGFYSLECTDILQNRDFRNFYTLSEEETEVLYLLTKGYTNTNRLAGYFLARSLDLEDGDFFAHLKRTKYLLPEDVPASKPTEKSVSTCLKHFLPPESAAVQKLSTELAFVRKQILQEDGSVRYEKSSSTNLPIEDQLDILLKREEGRIRRVVLPKIFDELEVESTIEALLWAQKWDLSKYYDLSYI